MAVVNPTTIQSRPQWNLCNSVVDNLNVYVYVLLHKLNVVYKL
jgi:hypothetical protein